MGMTSGGYRYHQQYLSSDKNPYGYCPDHSTGVSCPVGVVRADGQNRVMAGSQGAAMTVAETTLPL